VGRATLAATAEGTRDAARLGMSWGRFAADPFLPVVGAWYQLRDRIAD
jgi:hypothetical protein